MKSLKKKHNFISSYGRFHGLPWFQSMSESLVFVGGAGSIGSWLTFFLARASAQVVVIDNDTVGEENLAGQLYGKPDIGVKKVSALSNVVSRLCGENKITCMDSMVTDKYGEWRDTIPFCDVVCVGFDNMIARKIIYDHWKAVGKETSIFIDGRLAAESGEIYLLERRSSTDLYKAYEATYFPQEEQAELPCSMKSTTHCGAFISSLIVTQITNWLNNQLEGCLPRDTSNMEFHLPLLLIDNKTYKHVT